MESLIGFIAFNRPGCGDATSKNKTGNQSQRQRNDGTDRWMKGHFRSEPDAMRFYNANCQLRHRRA